MNLCHQQTHDPDVHNNLQVYQCRPYGKKMAGLADSASGFMATQTLFIDQYPCVGKFYENMIAVFILDTSILAPISI